MILPKEFFGERRNFSLSSIIGGIHSRFALMREQDLIESENGYREFMKRLWPPSTASLSNQTRLPENVAARQQLAKVNSAALMVGQFLMMMGFKDVPQEAIPKTQS